jgi:CCR4-NOT transcription complex subunit 2
MMLTRHRRWNRNWRWHKELRHWLTKETGTSPSQKVPGGEAGTYTFWDPESWTKERKDLTVLYSDLEEKSIPAFVQGPGLQPHPQPQPSGMSVAVGSQMGVQGINVAQLRQQVQAQAQAQAQAQGGGYQGMGIIAGMA